MKEISIEFLNGRWEIVRSFDQPFSELRCKYLSFFSKLSCVRIRIVCLHLQMKLYGPNSTEFRKRGPSLTRFYRRFSISSFRKGCWTWPLFVACLGLGFVNGLCLTGFIKQARTIQPIPRLMRFYRKNPQQLSPHNFACLSSWVKEER